MSNDRANELIKELIKELEQETALDLATVEQAKLLQNKFEDILNPNLDTSNNTMLENVIAREASFFCYPPHSRATCLRTGKHLKPAWYLNPECSLYFRV